MDSARRFRSSAPAAVTLIILAKAYRLKPPTPLNQTMTQPLLRPRTRRATTVFLSDAMIDQLDSLVHILPDAPNRSRLIESFLEMQLALLLNPTVALPLFLEGFHANLIAVAEAETLGALEADVPVTEKAPIPMGTEA